MIEPPLSLKEEIEILLKEYDTLRTEIIQRSNSAYQLYGVAAASIAIPLLTAVLYPPKSGRLLLIILLVVFLMVTAYPSASGASINCGGKRGLELKNKRRTYISTRLA